MTKSRQTDNPYQFILIAGARTNQLLKGAEPRVRKTKKRKATFVALDEVRAAKLNVTFLEPELEDPTIPGLDV